MKKMIFVLSACLFVFSFYSCENDLTDADSLAQQIFEADQTSINTADLPTNISEFTDDNYFETYIDRAAQAEGLGFQLTMGNEEFAFFDLNGTYLDDLPNGGAGPCGKKPHRRGGRGMCGNALDLAEVPQVILDYVATNYPDNEIKRAKLKEEQYVIGLKGHILLIFGEEGDFIEEFNPINNGGPCGGTPVAYEDLPATITDYIDSNFSDLEFNKAKQKDDGRYVVMLLDGEEKVILIFDEEGNFIEQKP